jgi:hypothetical protein
MQNPLTLEAFANWCKRPENRDRTYCWDHTNHCACGQYAEFLGIEDWPHHRRGGFWDTANRLAHSYPHTFAALAARCRWEDDFLA